MVKIQVSRFSSLELPPFVEAQYPWPEDCFLQAGAKGLVISSNGNYTTAFVEAFPNETFIRGEGATIEEAEKAAWDKYQTYEACPKHEYDPKNYTNGAGFCKHCNHFKGNVFSGEELGQYCYICTTGTTYGQAPVLKNVDVWEQKWFCEEHYKSAQTNRYIFLSSQNELDKKELSELSHLKWVLNLEKEEGDPLDIKEALTELFASFNKDDETNEER